MLCGLQGLFCKSVFSRFQLVGVANQAKSGDCVSDRLAIVDKVANLEVAPN